MSSLSPEQQAELASYTNYERHLDGTEGGNGYHARPTDDNGNRACGINRLTNSRDHAVEQSIKIRNELGLVKGSERDVLNRIIVDIKR